METNQDVIIAIRENIAADELQEAISALGKLLQGKPSANELTALSGSYQEALRQERLGIASLDQINRTKNLIRMGLLGLLDGTGQQPVSEKLPDSAKETGTHQNAEKIYNIGHIDKADFS